MPGVEAKNQKKWGAGPTWYGIYWNILIYKTGFNIGLQSHMDYQDL